MSDEQKALNILKARGWSVELKPAEGLNDAGWSVLHAKDGKRVAVLETAGRYPTWPQAVLETDAWWRRYREGENA